MWTQLPYNDKNPFTPFFKPQILNSLNYQAVLIFWAVLCHVAQAPPTAAEVLSNISIVSPSASCTKSIIFSMLEQL